MAGAVGLPCAEASGAGGSREPPHRAWGWRAPAVCSHGPNPSASRPHAHSGCWERGACAPNNGRSGEAKRNFQEERAPRAPAPPGATGRARSCWPQVRPQQERRRALGPGTRGGCVPAAPAAFQEQYCWHQAGSLRRQRIHGPFMRGAGMIYCLEEGAGVGGWSPLCPAPRACSLPRGPAHERGHGSGSVQANSKHRLSLVGFGAERVPLPRLHRAHLWAPPPRSPCRVGAPTLQQGARGGGHVPLAVLRLTGAARGAKGGAGAGLPPWHGEPALAQSPLVELLAWRRPWRCCRRRAAGGGPCCREGLFVCLQLLL